MTRKSTRSQPASSWQLAIAIGMFFLIIFGLSWSDQFFTVEKNTSSTIPKEGTSTVLALTLYSSPDCSCCHEYVAYLEDRGYSVDFIRTENYLDYFSGVPEDMMSCHIMFGDDYFVVGHVPETALSKLFGERPSYDGISLPGMPAGSPGMGGVKLSPFIIYGISGNDVTEFMKI